jgi:hypothetical protein
MCRITKELEGAKYDELEAQFTQFHQPGEPQNLALLCGLPGKNGFYLVFGRRKSFRLESRSLNESQVGFSRSWAPLLLWIFESLRGRYPGMLEVTVVRPRG